MYSSNIFKSSMERYSRFKTRKVLGVGQVNEGPIPASKILQLLGPVGQAGTVPSGFTIWLLIESALGLFFGSMLLLVSTTNIPRRACDTVAIKCLMVHQGSSMLGLSTHSLLACASGHVHDKLLAISAAFVFHGLAFCGSLANRAHALCWYSACFHGFMATISGLYLYVMRDRNCRDRSNSHNYEE